MNALLSISRSIDALSRLAGKLCWWLVLASVLISAGNAIVRKLFDISSNSWLEIQWYLFAGVFLLAAGYTMLNNEHVRIDVITSRLSAKARTWIDIIGLTFFVLPFVVIVTSMAWPVVQRAFEMHEMSQNAGGLVRWPVFVLLPLGFVLLGLQALSELVKRVAFLKGMGPDPLIKDGDKAAELDLAEAIRRDRAAGMPAPEVPIPASAPVAGKEQR